MEFKIEKQYRGIYIAALNMHSKWKKALGFAKFSQKH